ncbi:4-hydroxyphenylacetate 3-hydroxylase family protein [Chloroflexota bacterium]
MSLMTGKQYRDSLRKMRPLVYIFGERVENPVDHPIVIPSQNAIALTYDLAHDPQYEDLMTTTSLITGQKINRFCNIYKDIDDMIKKVKMVRMIGQKTATCFQRCTTMDTANALFIVTHEIDKKYGTEYHKRFINFLKEVQDKDLDIGVAMTDVKGDRSLRPLQQRDPDMYLHVVEEKSDGIVVKGAKANQTGSINCHYTFLSPTSRMREEEKDYALAFVVPTDAEGIVHIYGRQSGDTRKLEDGDIDIGNKQFGAQETVMVFDNVFIPWEHVFLYKENEFSGRLPSVFGANHRQTYGGCKSGVSDTLIGAVALYAESNGIDKIPHIQQKLAEMVRYTETVYSVGLATALEGQKMPCGSYFVNMELGNVCKMNVADLPFEMIKRAVDICGGILGTMPSEKELKNPETRKYMEKYLKGAEGFSVEDRMRIIYLIQSLLFGTNSVGYIVESVHGAGPPEVQKAAVRYLTDFKAKKEMAKALAGIKK